MLDDVDLLVVGAGPAGCTVAERAASVLGWRVLVIDRRPHLAGNCFDAPHASGVLVHRYGPHYFRTDDAGLLAYLSRFTDWLPARYVTRAYQVMPRHGFTALFRRMLDHPRIRVLLDCDFEEVRRLVMPRQATLYCGPLDEFFHHPLGRLPYRSLKFDFVPFERPF